MVVSKSVHHQRHQVHYSEHQRYQVMVQEHCSWDEDEREVRYRPPPQEKRVSPVCQSERRQNDR